MATTLLLQIQSRCIYSSQKYPSSLELEAAFAGAFSQLFDAAVVDITAAVEYDLGNPFFAELFSRWLRQPFLLLLCCRRKPSKSLSIEDAAEPA